MSNECSHECDADQPMVYQIKIKGHLSRQWSDWFEGLTITRQADGDTIGGTAAQHSAQPMPAQSLVSSRCGEQHKAPEGIAERRGWRRLIRRSVGASTRNLPITGNQP
jgi:hypothetical protein